MQHKRLILSLAAAVMLSVTACGSPEPEEIPSEAAETAETAVETSEVTVPETEETVKTEETEEDGREENKNEDTAAEEVKDNTGENDEDGADEDRETSDKENVKDGEQSGEKPEKTSETEDEKPSENDSKVDGKENTGNNGTDQNKAEEPENTSDQGNDNTDQGGTQNVCMHLNTSSSDEYEHNETSLGGGCLHIDNLTYTVTVCNDCHTEVSRVLKESYSDDIHWIIKNFEMCDYMDSTGMHVCVYPEHDDYYEVTCQCGATNYKELQGHYPANNHSYILIPSDDTGLHFYYLCFVCGDIQPYEE